MLILPFLTLCAFTLLEAQRVDYKGYKVLSITPKTEADLDFLNKLRRNHSLDLWNEPHLVGVTVMTHLKPQLIDPVEESLKKLRIKYEVAFPDLQSVIDAERVHNAPMNISHATAFNFGAYNEYNKIVQFLKDLSTKYPDIAKLETIGNTFENRPIYSLKISAGNTANKPAIMMDCGIHAREWSSVAAGAYLVNKLVTEYGTNSEVTNVVDKYDFHIVVEANPDGYVHTWQHNRLWRKNRSRSGMDWLGICKGTDPNRNFDVEHCGVGTSRKPCEEDFCGDQPFSESETRALRDLMLGLGNRLKAYFAIHAFSQFWMTPYGTTRQFPPNYNDLQRIGRAGVNALARKYGTQFQLGTIANIIYEASGSSLDYAYLKLNLKIGFALELRDQGRYGFFLPPQDIIPMCEETYDGLMGAIKAL